MRAQNLRQTHAIREINTRVLNKLIQTFYFQYMITEE